MTLFTPVYDTPLNQVGLAHKATYLELNKRTDFDPLYAIYAHAHEGAEKNSFTIAYRLKKNEIVYARYKVIFENGLESQYSPIKVITANAALKEYTLDTMSAVPATPVITVENYNKSDVPHEDITVKISDLRFYMGEGSLVATSWYLKDASDNLIWKSEKDKFNLNKIIISKNNFKEDGLYKIEACRVVKTGLSEYNSLNGTKIINVSKEAGLSNADKAIDIDFDNFKLYENRQSVLKFEQRIRGFKYLSVKMYDRNGILALDEIIADKSPVYINTTGIVLGREYTLRTTAYYIDGLEGIKNTRINSASFISEKSSESNTLMVPDYKNISKVGYQELDNYKDENIIYPYLSENLNNGKALLFIRDNMFFTGQYLESGMVFDNWYINTAKLLIPKNVKKLQVLQKPNGDYLISFINGIVGDQEEVKVVCFRIIETNNNVKDIKIIGSGTVLANTNNLHDLNRYIFTNISSRNILVTLDGTDKTTLTVYELVGNVIVSRASIDYELVGNMICVCKASTTSMSIITFSEGVIKTGLVSLVDLSSLDLSTEELELDEEIDEDNALIELLDKIKTIGHSAGKLRLNGAIIKKNILLFTIENDSNDIESRVFDYFKYNTQTKKLTPVETISSIGRDYPNSVIYGFNLIKTKLNNPPLRLIAES